MIQLKTRLYFFSSGRSQWNGHVCASCLSVPKRELGRECEREFERDSGGSIQMSSISILDSGLPLESYISQSTYL